MLRGLLRAVLSLQRFEALAWGSLRREYLRQDEMSRRHRWVRGEVALMERGATGKGEQRFRWRLRGAALTASLMA